MMQIYKTVPNYSFYEMFLFLFCLTIDSQTKSQNSYVINQKLKNKTKKIEFTINNT